MLSANWATDGEGGRKAEDLRSGVAFLVSQNPLKRVNEIVQRVVDMMHQEDVGHSYHHGASCVGEKT